MTERNETPWCLNPRCMKEQHTGPCMDANGNVIETPTEQMRSEDQIDLALSRIAGDMGHFASVRLSEVSVIRREVDTLRSTVATLTAENERLDKGLRIALAERELATTFNATLTKRLREVREQRTFAESMATKYRDEMVAAFASRDAALAEAARLREELSKFKQENSGEMGSLEAD